MRQLLPQLRKLSGNCSSGFSHQRRPAGTRPILARSLLICRRAACISKAFCRFSHSSADVPSALASLNAVSAVTPISPVVMRSIRVRGTPQIRASAPADMPSGFRYSSRSRSPGCSGVSVFVILDLPIGQEPDFAAENGFRRLAPCQCTKSRYKGGKEQPANQRPCRWGRVAHGQNNRSP